MRFSKLSIAVVPILVAALAYAQPRQSTVLHNFQGSDGGAIPFSSLTPGPGGVLYGTTYSGGTSGNGNVYQLTPPLLPGGLGTKTTLHSFAGLKAGDGELVFAGVAAAPAGNLYGATANGGTDQAGCAFAGFGCGIVYELSPPKSPGGAWTETILHVFQSSTDGAETRGTLIRDSAAICTGRLPPAGPSLFGTVFKLSPPTGGGAWNFQVLHTYSDSDGSEPFGSLVMDSAGVLYGTTFAGGAQLVGTAFRMAPPANPGGMDRNRDTQL